MVANRREVLVAEYLRSISSAERLAEDLPNPRLTRRQPWRPIQRPRRGDKRLGAELANGRRRGTDRLAVPYFNVDLLGHGEFVAAEALLHDMHDLTRNNTRPQHRQRIHPATADGVNFWELAR